MARFSEREKALILRKKEMSYSQIKEILGVSKSTLSSWLRNYPLSKERIDALRGKNEKRIEKYRETMRTKRESRLHDFYQEQKRNIFPISKRELFIAGLFLYWGEGSKSHEAELAISNTDPSIINFFIIWLTKSLMVPRENLKASLHLYKDMDVKKETDFWSETLNIPVEQFAKPYIKESLVKGINHKGGFGHGTCTLRTGNARLSEKVLMAIKAISDEGKKRP